MVSFFSLLLRSLVPQPYLPIAYVLLSTEGGRHQDSNDRWWHRFGQTRPWCNRIRCNAYASIATTWTRLISCDQHYDEHRSTSNAPQMCMLVMASMTYLSKPNKCWKPAKISICAFICQIARSLWRLITRSNNGANLLLSQQSWWIYHIYMLDDTLWYNRQLGIVTYAEIAALLRRAYLRPRQKKNNARDAMGNSATIHHHHHQHAYLIE